MSDHIHENSNDDSRSRLISARMTKFQGYPQGVPWVSMRGNRQNTGVSPLVGFNFAPNGRTPILAWADTNQDGLSLINATPVIGAGDVVYVGSSNNHFIFFLPGRERAG